MSVVGSDLTSTTRATFNYADGILGSSSLFSPSCTYIAIVSGSRLTVRDARSSEVLHIFSCIDKVEKAEFSPDSQFILCAMFSRNAVQIFSMVDGGLFDVLFMFPCFFLTSFNLPIYSLLFSCAQIGAVA